MGVKGDCFLGYYNFNMGMQKDGYKIGSGYTAMHRRVGVSDVGCLLVYYNLAISVSGWKMGRRASIKYCNKGWVRGSCGKLMKDSN